MTVTILSALVLLVIQLLLPHKAKPVANYDHLILVNEYKYEIYEIFTLVPLLFFTALVCCQQLQGSEA